jgi:two-component system phosphate regulon response regulator OmpR
MRAAGLATPFIMLTAMGDIDSRIDGLSSGADDYLPKPFEPKELKLRISNILKRVKAPAGKTALGGGMYDRERGVLDKGGRLIKLTTLEKNIISYLMDNAGGTAGRGDIAGAIGDISERSVDVAIARIRGKIEDNAKVPSIILTVRNAGYKIVLN